MDKLLGYDHDDTGETWTSIRNTREAQTDDAS